MSGDELAPARDGLLKAALEAARVLRFHPAPYRARIEVEELLRAAREYERARVVALSDRGKALLVTLVRREPGQPVQVLASGRRSRGRVGTSSARRDDR